MVSHCANPICHKPLHYLREGKIFLFSRKHAKENEQGLSHHLEHFWLCGICAKKWTLATDGNDGVTLIESRSKRFKAHKPAIPVAQAS